MSRTIHMCQSVEGPLMNYRVSDWKRIAKCVTRDDGSRMTWEEVKQWFIDELAKGHKVIPLGKPCEGFSYVTGCPGHEEPKETVTP